MKLKLSVVKSTGTGSWDEVTEHGTLKSLLEKGDKLFLSNKNLEGESRVVLFVQKGDAAPTMLPCSERLSKTIRKGLASGVERKSIVKALLALNVIENKDGNHFLVPEGKQGEVFTFEEVTKGAAVSLEDLIAY